MKFNPVRDNVIVCRETPEEMTPGGLHIPASAQAQSNVASVVAVGPGKNLKNGGVHPCSVAVGDTVLLQRWATNQEFKHHGIPHVVVPEKEILAVLKEDD